MLLDGCCCPGCHLPLQEGICPEHGQVAFVNGNMIEWRLVDAADGDAIRAEAAAWDQWATERSGVNVELDAGGWLHGSRTFRALLQRFPEMAEPAGLRMLDIGGTCRDAIKFLHSGVRRVDQVEVSSSSQALAVANLEASGLADWRDRVVFHNVPAETLPFEDGLFDIVFSRATIHHTDRTRSVPELHRVLKPGGDLLLVEAYLSPLMQPLMRLRRRLAKADRGSDAPFSREDLRFIRVWFPGARVYEYNVLWLPWSQTFHKTSWGKQLTPRVWQADLALGRAGGLSAALGQQCWIAARK